jgi:hypothetical protein
MSWADACSNQHERLPARILKSAAAPSAFWRARGAGLLRNDSEPDIGYQIENRRADVAVAEVASRGHASWNWPPNLPITSAPI